MDSISPASRNPIATQIEVRVRYVDCDPMKVAHHSVYPVWMEAARGELLRQYGVAYRDLEPRGIFFVVAKMSIRYRLPARYDEVLRIGVWQIPQAKRSAIKVDHAYEIVRDDDLLATASTTLVCIDDRGKPQAIPEGALSQASSTRDCV